jgi:lycopene cyclase CruP
VSFQRPQALLERYFELLPSYQGVPLADLKFKRVLFGGFPCYSAAPLQPQFDRIVQVGAAAACLA